LRDRDVRIRKHQQQGHPCAVIEPTIRCRRGNALLAQHRRSAFRHTGRAWRRIAQFVKGAREAIKIVDRLRPFGSARRRLRRAPVGGQHQNGARAWQRLSEQGKLGGRHRRIDRQRGRAVGNENGGQSAHGSKFLWGLPSM
jgi:hypothetical protein